LDKMQEKFEAEKKVELQKLKTQLGEKNDKIKELEKNEKKLATEKDKNES